VRGEETAHQTHFRIFRTDGPGSTDGAPGILAGNPVHEDIVEAVSMAPPTFLVNTLLTPGKRLFDVVAGALAEGPRGGMRAVREPFPGPDRDAVPPGDRLRGRLPEGHQPDPVHKALDNAFLATEPAGC